MEAFSLRADVYCPKIAKIIISSLSTMINRQQRIVFSNKEDEKMLQTGDWLISMIS